MSDTHHSGLGLGMLEILAPLQKVLGIFSDEVWAERFERGLTIAPSNQSAWNTGGVGGQHVGRLVSNVKCVLHSDSSYFQSFQNRVGLRLKSAARRVASKHEFDTMLHGKTIDNAVSECFGLVGNDGLTKARIFKGLKKWGNARKKLRPNDGRGRIVCEKFRTHGGEFWLVVSNAECRKDE